MSDVPRLSEEWERRKGDRRRRYCICIGCNTVFEDDLPVSGGRVCPRCGPMEDGTVNHMEQGFPSIEEARDLGPLQILHSAIKAFFPSALIRISVFPL